MKKIVILVLTILCLCLAGCVSETENRDREEELRYLLENFSAEEIVEEYGYSDFLEAINTPNMLGIIEELEDAKKYYRISQLIDIADEADYYPSAVYGEFCRDNRDGVVHKTDSDCFKRIPVKDKRVVSFLGPKENEKCSKCFGE